MAQVAPFAIGLVHLDQVAAKGPLHSEAAHVQPQPPAHDGNRAVLGHGRGAVGTPEEVEPRDPTGQEGRQPPPGVEVHLRLGAVPLHVEVAQPAPVEAPHAGVSAHVEPRADSGDVGVPRPHLVGELEAADEDLHGHGGRRALPLERSRAGGEKEDERERTESWHAAAPGEG